MRMSLCDAGHVTLFWPPARCQPPPALRSSHQAVPWAPESHCTTALRVAAVEVTLVAGLVWTPHPTASAARARARTWAGALGGGRMGWSSSCDPGGVSRARQRAMSLRGRESIRAGFQGPPGAAPLRLAELLLELLAEPQQAPLRRGAADQRHADWQART